MELPRNYASFRIEVRPSPETNDHQVLLFADDVDLIDSLDDTMIGMDPDEVFSSDRPLHATTEPHIATIARCGCGYAGCDSCDVEIVRRDNLVEWRHAISSGRTIVISFPSADYDRELERAASDQSWETPDRTAARLFLSLAPPQELRKLGLTVLWAGGRTRENTFTVSLILNPGPYQLLVHLPWADESPETIAARAHQLLTKSPSEWYDVEWFGQVPGLARPSIVRAGWKQRR